MGRPSPARPAQRTEFHSKDDKREYVCAHLLYWFWRPNRRRATYYADRLAKLLGSPTKECLYRYCHYWILIYDTRGDTSEAIRLANLELEEERQELFADKTQNASCGTFLDDVRGLQEGLFLQADRYLRIGDRARAKETMREATDLAERYGVELDAQERALLADLQWEPDSGSGTGESD